MHKRESETYQNLFELSPVPQWVYDIKTLKFLNVNLAAVRHYGYSKTEFLNITLKEIWHEQSFDLIDHTASLIEKGESFDQKVLKHLKKNRTQILVVENSNPILYEDKNARLVVVVDTTEIIVFASEINEQINSKIKLEESIERFEIISKATREAIWDFDLKRGEIIWNKGIKGIFGYDKLIYSHQWWQERLHPDDAQRVTNQIDLMINGSKSRFEIEYRFLCADGSFKHVVDRGFIKIDKNNGAPHRIIGSMQDITDSVKSREKIEAQNQRIIDISMLQSHQMRGSLTQVMGLVALLLLEKDFPESNKEHLIHLSKAAERLDQVICSIINDEPGDSMR